MIRSIIILPLLLANLLLAQKTYVDVAVDKSTVSTVENFTYQITTDCDCNIKAPDLSDFEIVSRQPGRFEQTFNNNGQVTSKCISSITYVLKAKKKGKFTIGTAKTECQYENKSSESISITVVDANEIHEANEGKASFYYKLVSDKESVFVGEPFKVALYLYTEKMPEDINNIVRGDALGLTRHPVFNERDPGHAFRQGKERIKGKEYIVIELINDVCFADEPGKLNIGAYYGSAVEQYRFLDASYMEGYSNSLQINVKKVPGDLPENYFGLAGDFEITHEISETTVKANHALDIWVTISGTGNFHMLKTPEFNFPKDSFLLSEPEVEKNLSVTENGPSGTVKYHYVLTPTVPGEFYVAPYSFAYFDWKTQQIKMVSTHEFMLKVLQGSSSGPKGPENPEIDVENDIRYIHTGSEKFFADDQFLYGSLLHWLAAGTPLGFFFFLLIIRRRNAQKSDDERHADVKKSIKRTSVKDIQKISHLQGAEAVSNLKQLLEEYFMTNLKVGRSALSKRYILDALAQRNIDAALRENFGEIWDKIEMARFAPISESNISELCTKTEKLLIELNQHL